MNNNDKEKWLGILADLEKQINGLKQYGVQTGQTSGTEWTKKIITTTTDASGQYIPSTTDNSVSPYTPDWQTPSLGTHEWTPPKFPQWPSLPNPAQDSEARNNLLDAREKLIEGLEAAVRERQAELDGKEKALRKKEQAIEEIERISGILAGDEGEDRIPVATEAVPCPP